VVDHVDRVVTQVGDIHAGLLCIGREVHRAGCAARRLRRDMNLADEAALANIAVRIGAGLAHLGRLEDLHAVIASII